MLQSPVWDDPYVGTHRESGEKILVLTWWCFAVEVLETRNEMPSFGTSLQFTCQKRVVTAVWLRVTVRARPYMQNCFGLSSLNFGGEGGGVAKKCSDSHDRGPFSCHLVSGAEPFSKGVFRGLKSREVDYSHPGLP